MIRTEHLLTLVRAGWIVFPPVGWFIVTSYGKRSPQANLIPALFMNPSGWIVPVQTITRAVSLSGWWWLGDSMHQGLFCLFIFVLLHMYIYTHKKPRRFDRYFQLLNEVTRSGIWNAGWLFHYLFNGLSWGKIYFRSYQMPPHLISYLSGAAAVFV